jgi:hypothetical protein
VSENRTTDAPRDPAFAAVARVLDAEKAFTAAVAVKDYSRDVGLDEARAALAATVATTPAGLYRVPEIVTRGRFPDGGESDSTWRTQEARHVGSDTVAPGF